MRIISRGEAGLVPRVNAAIRLPAPHLFLHHTVTAQFLGNVKAGARSIQQIAFGRGFHDISYNFLVFADGQIVEGRGWGVVGAHTVNFNSTSHAFSLVGDYHTLHFPTPEQINAVRWLTAEGKRLGKITNSAIIRPHRDVFSTACPGARAVTRLADFRVPWAGSPGPPTPTPPSTEGFLMALSAEAQQNVANQVENLHKHLLELTGNASLVRTYVRNIVREELDAYGLRFASLLDTEGVIDLDNDGVPG